MISSNLKILTAFKTVEERKSTLKGQTPYHTMNLPPIPDPEPTSSNIEERRDNDNERGMNISIKLLTKLGEDRMHGMAHVQTCPRDHLAKTCGQIQLLTKFGEDWMKTT
ncbi:hypothetical protein DPMN_054864 [Dreissena polymorpha]|uniref:Uncharacterized protein n=1 Tax=Dreissena polymorpha TaxID=45954 RepID=A0A9D4CRK1_DREPO|nr:hypothetical protein DPMN_054864 [Dreissena polymorpha]